MKGAAIRGLLLVVLVAWAAAACGGDGEFLLGAGETASTSPPATSAQPSTTTSAGVDDASTTTSGSETPTTTVGSTTTTTTTEAIPNLVEMVSSVELTASEEPAAGSDAVLGGAPDAAAAAALTAEMEEAGIGLAGIEILVWPVIGGGTLLVFEIDDRAAGMAEDTGASDLFVGALLASPIPESAGVTRLVFNYRGSDSEGPYTFTATYPFDVFVASYAEGVEPPDDGWDYQLARGP